MEYIYTFITEGFVRGMFTNCTIWYSYIKAKIKG